MYLFFVINLLHPHSCFSNMLPDALFLLTSLGCSVFCEGIVAWKYYDSLILRTQHSLSFMVIFFFLYYYPRQSTPLCKLQKIVIVIIRN